MKNYLVEEDELVWNLAVRLFYEKTRQNTHQKNWWFLSLIAFTLWSCSTKIEQIICFKRFSWSKFLGKNISFRIILQPPPLQNSTSPCGQFSTYWRYWSPKRIYGEVRLLSYINYQIIVILKWPCKNGFIQYVNIISQIQCIINTNRVWVKALHRERNNLFFIKKLQCFLVKKPDCLAVKYYDIMIVSNLSAQSVLPLSVGAYASKIQQIVYKHQQVELMKCRSNILQKNLFFKNIIYLVVNYFYASISLARLCFIYNALMYYSRKPDNQSNRRNNTQEN